MSTRGAIVVPTRNRPALAVQAVRSVIAEGSDVDVYVSDNSTDGDEQRRLAHACAEWGDAVVYMRPDTELPMTAHWEWALRQVLERSGPAWVSYLTDRMCFVPGGLRALIETASWQPNEVLTYNHDAIDDHVWPIQLRLQPWSGKVFRVDSRRMLWLASRGVIRPWLPRMLNSLVPRDVLDRLTERFGSVFGSIAPDFSFAFRCLDVQDSITYLDRPVLLQYALDRSNGASYSRGEQSRDRVDFERQLGTLGMNHAAPVPEFETVRNVIFHEYRVARAEAASDKFPEVDPRAYMAAIVEDFSLIENPAALRRMLAVLRDNGWGGAARRRWSLAVGAIAAVLNGWRVARAVMRFAGSAVRRALTPARARLLARAGIRIPAGMVGHRSLEEAMAYASRCPRTPTDTLAHIEPLLEPPGETVELSAPERRA
jgi:hypothetical protein